MKKSISEIKKLVDARQRAQELPRPLAMSQIEDLQDKTWTVAVYQQPVYEVDRYGQHESGWLVRTSRPDQPAVWDGTMDETISKIPASALAQVILDRALGTVCGSATTFEMMPQWRPVHMLEEQS